MKIEVNKIMNPAFLLGTAFNIAYWHRKYHSGTISPPTLPNLSCVNFLSLEVSFGSQPTASKHSSSTLDHFENMSMASNFQDLKKPIFEEEKEREREEKSVVNLSFSLLLTLLSISSSTSKDEKYQ